MLRCRLINLIFYATRPSINSLRRNFTAIGENWNQRYISLNLRDSATLMVRLLDYTRQHLFYTFERHFDTTNIGENIEKFNVSPCRLELNSAKCIITNLSAAGQFL